MHIEILFCMHDLICTGCMCISELYSNIIPLFFLNFQEHFNFYGVDEVEGPLVLSVKQEFLSSQEHLRVILR